MAGPQGGRLVGGHELVGRDLAGRCSYWIETTDSLENPLSRSVLGKRQIYSILFNGIQCAISNTRLLGKT